MSYRVKGRAWDCEHNHQVALFNWADLHKKKYPELGLMFSVPNEGKRGRKKDPKTGKWYSVEGKKLRDAGMKKGVPDIVLPVPRGTYAGLFVELKAGDNKPTPDQREWHEKLRNVGHMVVVCYEWQAAAEIIEKYLQGKFEF